MSEVLQCDHFPACSGCTLIGMPYDTQLGHKLDVFRGLFQTAGISRFDVSRVQSITRSPAHAAYRNRVRLAVAGSGNATAGQSSGIMLGLYRAGTHHVVDIPRCPVQPKSINDAVEIIREGVRLSGVALYDERTHAGDLRYVSVRAGINTGEVLVGLIATRRDFPGKHELAEYLSQRCSGCVGVVLNINPKPGNVIFGDACETLAGRGYLEETVCGVRIRLGLRSFFQINTGIAERAYASIVKHLTDGVERAASRLTVLDLYCGVGTIGLVAAGRVGKVIGVERDAEAIDHARSAIRTNGIENAAFFAGDVERELGSLVEKYGSASEPTDTLAVVVNPPRKGLTEATREQLITLAPDRIAYLSCAPETLLRDLAVFTAEAFTLRHVELFDMFPQTDQVETLAILDRR